MSEYSYLNKLQAHLCANDVLTECQHTFLASKSTSTAIHSVYAIMKKCECPVGILCNLSRAFDCVDHNPLFSKLQEIGILDHSLMWAESRLRGLQQVVSLGTITKQTIQNCKLEYVSITRGVPPFFFLRLMLVMHLF